MRYRTAGEGDLPALAAMRWDFRLEDYNVPPPLNREDFIQGCVEFLRQGLVQGNWTYWIAEEDGEIIAHMFVQRITKVPKPTKMDDAFGYLTNSYTRPAYRGRGIGTELLRRIQAWAREQDLELLLTWPSERSFPFYERLGFVGDHEARVFAVRPYIR